MAKRYSKFHSNFILKKKHQESTKGTIWERDWVTIGAQHQIEKGKRIFYGDTNFLFTDNTFNSYKKKHKFSKWVAEWTYDEAVENSSPDVNIVTTNWESNDLRDFAYYGSCVELVKIAILNIVKWFPGRMTKGAEQIYVGKDYGVKETGYYTNGYVLDNPFELNLFYSVVGEKNDDNENLKRYVADFYTEYQINNEQIINYAVYKIPYDCLKEITKICQIAILSEYNRLYFIDGYYMFGNMVYVEGDSPYTKYYTSIDEYGNYSKITPFNYDVYTDPIYIHVEDLDKVYVLVHDVEETIQGDDGEETITTPEVAVFKWGDEDFFTPPYAGMIVNGHRYNRNKQGDKTWQGTEYYCWSVEHGDSQDYDIIYEDIYTLTIEPRNGEYVWLWVSGDGTSYDMMSSETASESFTIESVIEAERIPLFNYTIYDYWTKNEDEEETYISIEEYENLSEEEKSAYNPRYYWPMSVEEYSDFNDSLLPNGYYFTINILDGDDNGIDPFFGEIGVISTLQERPQNVTDYVNSLRGIEHLLLNNKTNPLYKATLITPVETNNGYIYTEKFYTWPSTNGYIDVSSVMYHQYMDRLIDTATIFDDTWCDNLWRNMTHESIRNFDWTYKKDYIEGDEEAFVEGGRRMQDIIHIYGRVADELKRYIQGIRMTTTVTYDNYNNMPTAEMSDKLEYRGWDVFSTIPAFKPSDEIIAVDSDFIGEGGENVVYTGEDIDDGSDDEETDTTKEIENSYDYSTVKIDESFMKSYIQKERKTISHVEYYRLPVESRSKYSFDYIRVNYDTQKGGDVNDNTALKRDCINAKWYDAYGTDIISISEYKRLNEVSKTYYTLRSQDVIITKEEYDHLTDECAENYEVYQYVNTLNSNDVLYATTFNNIYWAEDYLEQPIYNTEGEYMSSVYCEKQIDDNGDYVLDNNGDFVCEDDGLTFKRDEYLKFRRGKDKYEPYTYKRKDDIVYSTDIGYSEYMWVNTMTIDQEQWLNLSPEMQENFSPINEEDLSQGYIGKRERTEEEYNNIIEQEEYQEDEQLVKLWESLNDEDDIITNSTYETLSQNVKSEYVEFSYIKEGRGDYIGGANSGYVPYSIVVPDYGIYPVSSFYPYEYERFSPELFNISGSVNLADEDYDDDVVIEEAKEVITMYQYNNIDNWKENFFVYEYFKPTDVNNWVNEANTEGLTKYSWETVTNLEGDENDTIDEYRPYRYISMIDSDTVITPERWMELPSKTDWRIVSYKCSLNDNIVLTSDEYDEGAYEYRRLNVISQAYYESLSQSEKLDFAPYEPTENISFDRWFNARNYAAETMGDQDIRFVKELMMSSRQIFASKGTRQGIDMIMSMFGFGPDTYTLTEKYHRIDISNHVYDESTMIALTNAADNETIEESYDDDEFFPENTVPMNAIEMHGVKYIIPYCINGRQYAGSEFYFQSKGGWGYRPNDVNSYNYMETMSYLKVVGTVSDLLTVNARSVSKGDIYYVISLLDIVDYDKNPQTDTLSHFFYLNDDFNPHLYRSWINIDITSGDNSNNGTTEEMVRKAKYLDSIVSTSVGNNPHTGYGKYDLGNNFLEYIRKPFKYYLDNYILDADTRTLMESEDATYKLVTSTTQDLTGKVKNLVDREIVNRKNPLDYLLTQTDRYSDDYEAANKTEDDYLLTKKQYYINDKTLIMTNHINNDLYKKYFFEVIVNYLMQMIPSTTILILENFEIENDNP